jgi:hypothetical protein
MTAKALRETFLMIGSTTWPAEEKARRLVGTSELNLGRACTSCVCKSAGSGSSRSDSTASHSMSRRMTPSRKSWAAIAVPGSLGWVLRERHRWKQLSRYAIVFQTSACSSILCTMRSFQRATCRSKHGVHRNTQYDASYEFSSVPMARLCRSRGASRSLGSRLGAKRRAICRTSGKSSARRDLQPTQWRHHRIGPVKKYPKSGPPSSRTDKRCGLRSNCDGCPNVSSFLALDKTK